MERKCNYCFQIFTENNGRIFSNHVKWCEKNPKRAANVICEFCNKKIDSLQKDRHRRTCPYNPTNLKHCPNCDKIIEIKGNKYCSQVCAATISNKQRLVSNNPGYREKGYKFDREERQCIKCQKRFELPIVNKRQKCDECIEIDNQIQAECNICHIQFLTSKCINRRTCSEVCYKELLAELARNNPNFGGELHYRKYTYNNIVMDSSWEVSFAKYLDDLKIIWIRSRKLMHRWTDSNNKKHRYYPDFYLPKFDIYVDPKNKMKLEKDREKLKRVVAENGITLLVGELNKLIRYIHQLNYGELTISKGTLLIVDDA